MKRVEPKALVLVVEDNDDVRNIITLYLRRNGYSVAEAADGISAVEAVASVEPDMILLDVLLPRLDGLEVLKRVRASETAKHVPVVMMSAVLQTRDLKAETERLDVVSFLEKPFQMNVLMEHVERALDLRSPDATMKPEAAGQPLEWRAETRLQFSRKSLSVKGKIEELPVPEILHSIFLESRTGRLQFIAGTAERLVFFQNGLPVYAESSVPEETLGAHLQKRGRITPKHHATAVEEMTRSGNFYGEVLLKLGLLTPHQLFTELEHHLTEKVIATFSLREGAYRFEEGDSWKEDVIVARMKPGRILMDGVQRFWSPGDVRDRIGISDSSRSFPLDGSPYSEEHLALSTQESRILQLIRRGLSLGDIVKQTSDRNLVVSTLYALYVMEHVGFILSGQQKWTESKAFEPESEPGKPEGDKEDLAKELLAEYLKYRTADYFTLLGVSREATPEEMTAAFKARKTKYHPDRLIGIDRGLVHEKIEELYVRIHNAYRTLINPEANRRYVTQLEEKFPGSPQSARSPSGPGSAPKPQKDDAALFEQGFTFLSDGKIKDAHRLFQQAHELSPKPRYEAYKAWTAFLLDPQGQGQGAKQLLKKLHKDNKKDPLFSYLLGNVALREKDAKQATAYFELAVSIDPQHIESARQLRILRMRQKGSEMSTIFQRFKKK